MIRTYRNDDLEAVLDIWLRTSREAHDFVESGYWESQLGNMREIYLPASEVYVYEIESEIVGFYALHEDTLAAIFVLSEYQGQGIGKALVDHAKTKRDQLNLTVYKENPASYGFYLSQGFVVVSEGQDEHTCHIEYTMVYPGV